MNAANYFKDQRRFLIRISNVSAEDDLPVTTYRASHIVLDYLQASTPKHSKNLVFSARKFVYFFNLFNII